MINPMYRQHLRDGIRRTMKMHGLAEEPDTMVDCLTAAGIRVTESEVAHQSTLAARMVATVVVTAYLWEEHPYHIWFRRFVEKCCTEGPEAATLGVDMLDPQSLEDLRKWLRG